jgi:hypothetical protein
VWLGTRCPTQRSDDRDQKQCKEDRFVFHDCARDWCRMSRAELPGGLFQV